MKKFVFAILILSFSFYGVFSQTGFVESFDAPSGKWLDEEENNYNVDEAEGYSYISVSKQEPWESVGFEIGSSLDLSENPYAGFKIKSELPFQLSFYLVSGNSNILKTVRVYPSDDWVNYFIDFSDFGTFDITTVDKLLVAINGASVTWSGNFLIDDLKLGDQVTKMAGITGISNQNFKDGSKNNVVYIKDIKNASQLTFSGGEELIENGNFTPVINGISNFIFDAKSNVSGIDTITIEVKGVNGYQDNSTSFLLSVSENNPPSIDNLNETIETAVGKEVSVTLTGITDGNPESDQNIEIIASSGNQTILSDSDISYEYLQGNTSAELTFKTSDAGSSVVLFSLVDDGDGNDSTSIEIAFNSYSQFNEFPEIEKIKDQIIDINDGLTTIPITGISDGNSNSQTLSFSLTSSNQEVLPNDSIRVVDYEGGNTANLEINPATVGSAIITLNVSDDGAGTDNGPLSTELTFNLEVVSPLLTGREINFDGVVQDDLDRGLWSLHDGQGGKYTISYVDSGSFNAMKVECNDKYYWDGFNLNFTADTALDLSENQYLSMEVYSVDEATLHWIWFYDNTGIRNDVTNRDNENMFWAPAGQWTEIIFDYTQENDMLNSNSGEKINESNIVRVLFNMHNDVYTWPPPGNYNGTFLIRNLKVGSKASRPEFTPTTTIDPIPDLTVFENDGLQEITLSGITDGNEGAHTPEVVASSSNPLLISDLVVSEVVEEKATLTFTPNGIADTATITLTIKAEGSDSISTSFFVQSFTSSASEGESITVDLNQRHQTISGFGTYMNSSSLSNFYVEEMGASAMRIGLISNQLEPVNDNSDPYSLNRANLNYDAFNWDYFKDLKERGVETFIITSWSPPAWMKQNLSLMWSQAGAPNYNATNNQLEEYLYEEFAESMVAVVKVFKEETGIDIAAIGPQNEPAFNEPYASAILSPEYFAKLIAVIGKRFEKEGLNTKIYMPEQVFSQNHYSMSQYIDAVQANPEANKYTDIIAVHGYAADGIGSGAPNFSQWSAMYQNAQEGDNPKELWMTETHRGYNSYDDAMWIATAIYGSLEYGNIGLWTQWSFEGQHVVNAAPTQMLYTCSNFFKYIRPEAVRVKTVSGNSNLLATSYIHEDDGTFTSVILNISDQSYKAYVSGEGLPEQYNIYRTSKYEKAVDLGLSTDSVILFPPNSVTTLYASGNMAPTIDQVDNIYLPVDAAQQDILLTGISYGSDEIPQNLSIEATSDNTDLIPTPALGAITDGESTLSFQPTAGSTGAATVTVTVTDDGTGFGSNSKTMSFVVHVLSSINNAPTFDPISDYYTKEDNGEQIIQISNLSDGDDESQNITGVVTCDNTELIPSISFSDNGDGTASVAFTTSDNVYGEAIVKLLVTDDGGEEDNNGDQSYEQTFKVFVAPVNDAPLAQSVEDQTIDINSPEQTITINGISDGEDYGQRQNITISAISSDTSIIREPSITFSGGNSANINYQPVAEKSGTVEIKVTIKDDGGITNGGVDTLQLSFNVTISAGTGIIVSKYSEVKLYPNPAKEFVVVDLPSNNTMDKYMIFDKSGRLIKTSGFSQETRKLEINVSDIHMGSYILVLTNNNKEIRLHLLIENK